ncbi:tripartite tricarboxylate transporter TctB family protein [Rhodocyclus tenuis]|uniref:DUF1468 domain-containing protein n=2 Tax=Rhodocyclus TaxID=1064 RepID=A0A6L5JYG6_RHOTE|nr:tripartite tricarboxylate transporter TctB family protein [Rhodocyclus gracilis]MQY52375.1 hypothetical protein [Rhodocyclus gracilis]NJA90209.1 tripartite tricarboxylate transporter TctB family protein [Rhodocyclus gracilis]
MKLRLIGHRDIAAGLFFFVLGSLTAWGSTAYKLGNAMRMGPGYFPLALGLLLAALGLLLVLRNTRPDLLSDESRLIEKPCLRSLGLIGFSLLTFAFALQTAGLIVATLGLVIFSGIAYRAFNWKELGLLSGGLATFAVLVFAYGLGLPLQVFPA